MKKLPLGIRLILGFLSFLLCIALFVSTICAAVLGDLNIVFQKDNLQQLFKEVLFTSTATRQPAAHAIAGNGHGGPGLYVPNKHLDDMDIPENIDQLAEDSSAMVEWIYDSLTDQYPEAELPALEEVQDFVEESTLDDFLAEKTASIVYDLYTGENTTTITTEEIQQQLEQNAQLIQDTFQVEISTEAIQEIVAAVEESEIVESIQKDGVNSVIEDMVSSGALQLPPELMPAPEAGGSDAVTSTNGSSAMGAINTLRSAVSMTALLTVIGICLGLIALLLVVNLKQLWVGVIDAGITVTVAGAILTAPLVLKDLLNDLLSGEKIIKGIVNYVLKFATMIHVGILVGGIVLIVVGIVLKVLLRKRAMAKAALAAAAAEAPAEEIPAVEAAIEAAPVEEAPAEEAPAETV